MEQEKRFALMIIGVVGVVAIIGIVVLVIARGGAAGSHATVQPDNLAGNARAWSCQECWDSCSYQCGVSSGSEGYFRCIEWCTGKNGCNCVSPVTTR